MLSGMTTYNGTWITITAQYAYMSNPLYNQLILVIDSTISSTVAGFYLILLIFNLDYLATQSYSESLNDIIRIGKEVNGSNPFYGAISDFRIYSGGGINFSPNITYCNYWTWLSLTLVG